MEYVNGEGTRRLWELGWSRCRLDVGEGSRVLLRWSWLCWTSRRAPGWPRCHLEVGEGSSHFRPVSLYSRSASVLLSGLHVVCLGAEHGEGACSVSPLS